MSALSPFLVQICLCHGGEWADLNSYLEREAAVRHAVRIGDNPPHGPDDRFARVLHRPSRKVVFVNDLARRNMSEVDLARAWTYNRAKVAQEAR